MSAHLLIPRRGFVATPSPTWTQVPVRKLIMRSQVENGVRISFSFLPIIPEDRIPQPTDILGRVILYFRDCPTHCYLVML